MCTSVRPTAGGNAHLLFRDYLRARPGTRAQYGELDDAEQWAAAAGWRP